MGKKKNGQYIVRLNWGWWTIYRLVNVRDDNNYGYQKVDSEPQFPYEEREAAVRRMFELNGWRYRS